MPEPSFTVHLKLSRFVFEGQATGKGAQSTTSAGRLFSLHWSRTNRTTPIGKSRLVKAAEQHSGMGTVIDFVSQTATFMVEASAMHRQQDRVIIFTLVSRDGSPLGSGPSGAAEDVAVCSGTIDLSMFTNDSAPKMYALVMESNFYVTGKLHFGLFVTNTPKSAGKVFQERAVVIFVDQIVDEVMESRIRTQQSNAAALKVSAPHLEDTVVLYDDRYYFAKVEMDDSDAVRLPVTKAMGGHASFKTSVPLKPVSKVKFVLCDEKQTLAQGSVKVDKLTAAGLPKDFALPLKGEKGSSLRVHFTIREELVTREVKTPPLTDQFNRSSPTPVLDQKPPTPVSPSGPTARVSPPVVAPGAVVKLPANGSSRPSTGIESTQTPLLPKTPLGALQRKQSRDDPLALTHRGSSFRDSRTPVNHFADPESESGESSAGATTPAAAPVDKPTIVVNAPSPQPAKQVETVPPMSFNASVMVPVAETPLPYHQAPTQWSTQTPSFQQVSYGAVAQPVNGGVATPVDDTVSRLVTRVQLLERMLLEAHDTIYARDRQISELRSQLARSQGVPAGPLDFSGFSETQPYATYPHRGF